MVDIFEPEVIMRQKMQSIKVSGLDQYLHENLTWERTLSFYQQENAFLKTRLSQVVDGNIDKEFVALAERFHFNFIQTDEAIKELKNDTWILQKQLQELIKSKHQHSGQIEKEHKKLGNDINFFEKKFAIMKNDFNSYLASFL